jgi:hypothetical protein
MTRTGSTKTVPKDHWRGRLAKARGFLKLAMILSRKDEVEYGARLGRMDQARRMLDDTEALAEWAESQLAVIFPGRTAAVVPSTEED